VNSISQAETLRRRKLVDELGAIDTARAEEIKKEIRDVWMASADPAEAVSFPGDRYIATVTARRMEREVDLRKVYKCLGINWLLKWAKVSVKVVEDHIALPDRAGMISEERTGSRSVTVAALAQTAKKKAA